jgi:hypothetical protein
MAGVLRYRARTAAQGCRFPSLGNPERNNQQYYELFNVSTPYYSFHWGTAHFIVLNSDIGNVSTSEMARDSFWAEQTRWLEKISRRASRGFPFRHRSPPATDRRRAPPRRQSAHDLDADVREI